MTMIMLMMNWITITMIIVQYCKHYISRALYKIKHMYPETGSHILFIFSQHVELTNEKKTDCIVVLFFYSDLLLGHNVIVIFNMLFKINLVIIPTAGLNQFLQLIIYML